MTENRSSLSLQQRRERIGESFISGNFVETLSIPVYTRHSERITSRKARGIDARPKVNQDLLMLVKRVLDFFGALGAVIFTAPLLIGIMLAIRLTSKGPIFFRQQRYGLGNREFQIYKFRTMYTHLGDETGVTQTASDDPRITRVGRFLRRTSLDELPQLFNVIKGDMSLVGPRPHVPGMRAAGVAYEELAPDYFDRHAVRPGITGLAQVNGFRGSTADRRAALGRIALDLTYIDNWSLWLDVRIIIATIVREFLSGSGH